MSASVKKENTGKQTKFREKLKASVLLHKVVENAQWLSPTGPMASVWWAKKETFSDALHSPSSSSKYIHHYSHCLRNNSKSVLPATALPRNPVSSCDAPNSSH